MFLKNITYSCGGLCTEYMIILFLKNTSDPVIYTGHKRSNLFLVFIVISKMFLVRISIFVNCSIEQKLTIRETTVCNLRWGISIIVHYGSYGNILY